MRHTITLLAALLLASFAAVPTVRAQAPETGAESFKPKSRTGTALIEFGYRPEGMTMWDPWFVAHEGQVHLFHLQRLANGSKRTAAEADHIGHAVTRDLIHWTELPLTVGPGEKGGMEDMQPWTGCAVFQKGVFHLFYTMRSTRDASRSNYGGGGIQRIEPPPSHADR